MKGATELLDRVWRGFAPPPSLTVSEWADAYRILPDTSAEPGPWRTDRAPYLRGVMDAILDVAVWLIVFSKSAQVGGSETLLNILGYLIALDPGPALLVQPTIEMAQAFSKDRLATMVRDTPALRNLVQDGRGTGTESTLLHKLYPRGHLSLAGANSPASLAQRPVRVLLMDDLDRFPPAVGTEGDPVDLAIKRTTRYWNRKILLVSTPTIKGGRIEKRFADSDQRRFFVPCPRCGTMDYLVFSPLDGHIFVRFDQRDPLSARLECSACGGQIADWERPDMVAHGEWRPTATPAYAGVVGFHIWEAYAAWRSLPDIVAAFLSARERGAESLRVFVNTTLGQGFADRTQRVEPSALLTRREDYGLDIDAPEPVACLTAGVDVQADRFELLVVGWGMAEERWVVDWRMIPGDPRRAETQAALLGALSRRYRHGSGLTLPILATCVDSGYATDAIYDFVLQHQHRGIYATKGYAGQQGKKIVYAISEKTHGPRGRPVRLHSLNVDDAKAEVVTTLAIGMPGPCYWHLPQHVDTVDEEFAAQLSAEQRIERETPSGVKYWVWEQVRDRNEALDAAALCLAALRILRPALPQYTARIRDAAARLAEPSNGMPTPVAPSRRFTRSAYLGAPR